MPFRSYVLLLLAAGHLLTVVCGACYSLPDTKGRAAAQILRWYATMSGASSSYGFFAPAVGSPHRAKFLLTDEKGSEWWDVFDQAGSSEARLRLTGIVDGVFMSGDMDELPQWRKQLVKSWAATMFNRHPSAVSLKVVVEYYDVPTIAEYRAGSRSSWETVYRAQLQRHAPAAQMRTDQ